jgi:hypothetical protein
VDHLLIKANIFACLILWLAVLSPSARAAPVFDTCLSWTINTLLGGAQIHQIKWGSEKLSEAQYRNLMRFSSRAGKRLKPGMKVELLTEREIQQRTSAGQEVGKNSDADLVLLERSQVDTKPREVLRFRLHMSDGRVLAPGIEVLGDGRSVDFDEASARLFQALNGDVNGIDEVEIVHTHPYHAVRITPTESAPYFRPVDLSDEDLSEAARFAERIPSGKKVTIKAVTPSGLNFSRTFKTGRRTER